jgi:HPt (histidine-containing phosphotransfer) domain-containing protein
MHGRNLGAAPMPARAVQPEASLGFGEHDTDVLSLFKEHVPMQLDRLDGALATGHIEEVRAQAHKLKGTMFCLSAQRAARLAEQLQRLAERADLVQGKRVFGELLKECAALEGSVDRELARRHPGS